MKRKFLGHFRIEEELGRGGMGVVYRAIDERLGREVALKILHPNHETDPKRRQRLIKEARTVSRIAHPNVAAVYELGESDGQPFIAMELVRGKSLRQRLSSGPLDAEEAIRIVSQVCEGLAAAHKLGIVHRDLKPENISLTPDGLAKILDFGVAHLQEDLGDRRSAETATTRTFVGSESTQIVGTAPYMSPEQLKGGPVDSRSDIFSLGVVFYEVLVGQRPFHRNSQMQTIEAILWSESPAVREKRPEIIPRLNDLIRRCIEKEPKDRFQDCESVIAALDDLKSGARLSRWRGAAVLAVGVAMVLAGVAAVMSWAPWTHTMVEDKPSAMLTVAVAPFSTVGGKNQQRGQLIKELIERELRYRTEGGTIRLLEGSLVKPIPDDLSARDACHRLNADIVVWGEVLEAGFEGEIESRITLIRPIDGVPPLEVSLGLGTPKLTDMIQRIPLDNPGELDLFGKKAKKVGDLVTTLVGLAEIRNGSFQKAATTLAAIEDPTEDQLFYEGIARLRAQDTLGAKSAFSRLMARSPSHTGAALGLLALNALIPGWNSGAKNEDIIRKALEDNPLDVRSNLTALVTVGLLPPSVSNASCPGEGMELDFIDHVRRIACDGSGSKLPKQLFQAMILRASFPCETQNPRATRSVADLWNCPTTLTAMASSPLGLVIACSVPPKPAPEAFCKAIQPEVNEFGPILYVIYKDEIQKSDELKSDPEMLRRLAGGDSALQTRSVEWAAAMSIHGNQAEQVASWLGDHLGFGVHRGRALAYRGALLASAGRGKESEESFDEAEALLGRDPMLIRFRASWLMRAGRFAEAAEYIGETDVPEKALALAGLGRWSEAALSKWKLEPIPSEGVTPRRQEILAMIMRRLYAEVERKKAIGDALGKLFLLGAKIRGKENEFEAFFWFRLNGLALVQRPDGETELPLETGMNLGPAIPFRLPEDPLSLLTFVSELSSERSIGSPVSDEEVRSFVRQLSLLADQMLKSVGEKRGQGPVPTPPTP